MEKEEDEIDSNWVEDVQKNKQFGNQSNVRGEGQGR